MIYRVVLDELIDILTPDNPLINPSVELELNSAGSFNFTLPPDHPAWNEVFVLKTTVDVYEDNELIFTGRVANIDKNWNNERVVECEGALAYFNDSVQRPMKWETPLPIAVDPDDQPEDPEQHIRNFLEDILNNHNAFVPENRQIHMGHIYIDHCDVTREVEYDTTLDVLTRMCIDTNGGWFMIRKDPTDHKLYLDWLKDFTQESDQKAQFGVNLLDFGAGVHAEDVCTGVLARGAEVNDNTLLLTDVELVDETTYPDMSVTHYVDHDQDILWHREGVAAFGEVVQVHDFSDAQTAWKDAHGEVVANSLFEVAKKWLEEKNTKVETFEVEVAELGWLEEGVPVLRLGQIVELNDAPHMTGEPVRKLPMYKLSCDLNSGSKRVTLGTPPKKELTQISASNSDANTLSTSGSSSGSGGSGSGEECKVHDVRVDGTSVVTDKIANISLTGKADTSVVNALAATVATKADASAVVALADVVSGKQDQIEFNTQEAATEVLTRLKANDTVYNLGGGTEVEANPSESATDDLNTIKIGDTVYDISGGGGSTNYGKFKCDVLFVNDPLPSPTSGTTNVTRTYTLNESIDDYDAVYVVIYNYYRSGQGTTNITSRIVFKNDYYLKGFDNYSYYDGFTDPDRTRRINFTFTDSTHIQTLSFRNESDNEPILYKVYGLKFENKLINRSDIYSEEERMIGRWTDGKPLYQKTYKNLGINLPASTWTPTGITFSDIDYYKVISNKSYLIDSQSQYPMLYRYYQGTFQAFCQWQMPLDELTLQYTKTTDTPDSGVIPEDPMFISDPMIYSEEEQVVGSWTDGKPLYQKTFLQNWTSDGEYHIDVTSLHIDKFIKSEGYANRYDVTEFSEEINVNYINNVNSYKFLVWYNRESEYLRVLLYMPEHKSSRQSITIQYTKTTDSILSGPKKGKIVQRSDIYSEEERLIGRWTDGKPLYQKTWNDLSYTVANNSWINFITVPNGIDLIDAKFYGKFSNDLYEIVCEEAHIDSATGILEAWFRLSGTRTVKTITLQYTKTTDLPFSKQLIEDPQFVMMSDIYSEDEQVVGRWTDGKPLYQKSVTLLNVSASTNTHVEIFDASGLNIENVIDISGTIGNSSKTEVGVVPWISESSNVLKGDRIHYYRSDNKFKFDTFNDSWSAADIRFTFKYTKTTDAPGSGPTKGNLIYLPALYSEEEREVGVWTDGKPLYQKTINFGSLPNNTTKTVSSGLTNVVMHNVFGVAIAPNGFTLTLPHRELSGTGNIDIVYQADNYVRLATDYNYSSYTSYITLQYTKTTDIPGSGTFLIDGTPSHHYSTSEKVVGTWIDGSTVYERTWDFGSEITLQSNTWYSTSISASGFGKIIRTDGSDTNGTNFPIGAAIDSVIRLISFRNTTTGIKYLTLQYTKSS